MNISQLLLAFFIYLSLGAIFIGYAACVMAGRSDDEIMVEAESPEYKAISYTLAGAPDEHLALG